MARVGSQWVELAQLQSFVEQGSGEPWPRVDERVATRLFDQLLERRVLLQVADREHPELLHGGSTSLETLVDALCPPPEAPDAVEVERLVRELEREPQPTRVRARQLLLRSRVSAEEARKRLLEGEPFEELSAEMSQAPNAAQGGGLGVVAEGDLPPSFDDAIFSLEAGGVSEAVEGPAGYHIFQVLERFEEGATDRRAVRERVVQQLRQEARRTSFASCLRAMADDLGVTVYEERLWFRYDGRYVEATDEDFESSE